MKRVAIDVDSVVPYYALNQLTGIGRTTMELVHAFDQIERLPVELLLYSQNMKGLGARNLQTHFPTRHLYLPFRDKWNKALSHTPLREWLTGCDLYHIPHNFDYVHRPGKTIITLHDTLFFTCPEEAFDVAFARQHYTALAWQCKGIITCSQSSKEDIIHYMGLPDEKITVIPWGVNHDTFHPLELSEGQEPVPPTSITTGSPFPRKTFLCVSCSKGRKNTLAVVKAYAQFIRHYDMARHEELHNLTLVWKQPSKEVSEIIRQNHLRHKIDIISGLSDTQLAQCYNQATCSFFPSRYEGFGLPVLESMACGTPVVTCRNSSLPEVGGAAALYVDPDDMDGMTCMMTQFEEGQLSKAALRPGCIAQAAKYTWRQCAEKTLEYYLHCLADNPV